MQEAVKPALPAATSKPRPTASSGEAAREFGGTFGVFMIAAMSTGNAVALVMILQRAGRDIARCKKKYGADWDRYCEEVPYLFIPYVF